MEPIVRTDWDSPENMSGTLPLGAALLPPRGTPNRVTCVADLTGHESKHGLMQFNGRCGYA